jgi:hypothetical protein
VSTGPRADDPDKRIAQKMLEQLWLPRPWSMRQFIANLELTRKRPIEIRDIDPDLAPTTASRVTGLWKPQESHDLILISPMVPVDNREHVISHEIGHILMWDAQSSENPPALHYLLRTFPHLPPTVLARQALTLCAARAAFEHPVERQAEWFAILLGVAAEERIRPIVRPDAPVRARVMAERASAIFGWD